MRFSRLSNRPWSRSPDCGLIDDRAPRGSEGPPSCLQGRTTTRAKHLGPVLTGALERPSALPGCSPSSQRSRPVRSRRQATHAESRPSPHATGAGVKPGVHILRYTFCSHLAMRGAPARAIQELAGHEDLTTTRRYMRLSPAAIDGAIRLLDEGAPGVARGNIGATCSIENSKSSR